MFEYIEIEWQDDINNEKLDIFDGLEIDTYQKEPFGVSFRVDNIWVLKKTPLNKIINYVLEKVEIKIANENITTVINFIAYTILACTVPKSLKDVFCIDDNTYREIENLFDSQFGDKYLLKEKTKNLPESMLMVIDYLVQNKILQEEKDRFWVHKVILKNIRIDFLDKPNTKEK